MGKTGRIFANSGEKRWRMGWRSVGMGRLRRAGSFGSNLVEFGGRMRRWCLEELRMNSVGGGSCLHGREREGERERERECFQIY
ncbi:unnamed protein product [Prunus armeniaca]